MNLKIQKSLDVCLLKRLKSRKENQVMNHDKYFPLKILVFFVNKSDVYLLLIYKLLSEMRIESLQYKTLSNLRISSGENKYNFSNFVFQKFIFSSIQFLMSDKLDPELDIQLPDYIMGFIQNDRNDFQNQIFSQNSESFPKIQQTKQKAQIKQNFQQIQQKQSLFVDLIGQQIQFENYIDSNEQNMLEFNLKANNKLNKKNQSAKRYRQRKREHWKTLEQENRFLRKKVQQLTFRLNETQVALNKFKYGDQVHTSQFQNIKEDCMKQMRHILSENKIQKQKITQIQNKLYDITAFNGKQKLNLLNYFMSELLENVIDDRCIYFMDCTLNGRGVYRQSKQITLRRMDIQIFQIMNIEPNSNDKIKILRKQIVPSLFNATTKFKQTWKQLYRDYLKLLSQGLIIQNIMKPLRQQMKNSIQVDMILKLELYFDKIKYREDMRQLRQFWFKENSVKEDLIKIVQNENPSKRIKQMFV